MRQILNESISRTKLSILKIEMSKLFIGCYGKSLSCDRLRNKEKRALQMDFDICDNSFRTSYEVISVDGEKLTA